MAKATVRAVAAVAEATCADKGLCWPVALAPYPVHVVATGKDQAVFDKAFEIAGELEASGVDVLVDDRKASPGVKFADAEILGMPVILVIGRGLAEGKVELRDRRTGERNEVAVGDAVAAISELLAR